MSRHVKIVTPENIELSYELAGIGSRFAAALIDHFFQTITIVAIVLLTAAVTSSLSMLGRVFQGSFPSYVGAIAGIVVFAVIFGYFTLFEILWSGRTPGKRAIGLRVVRDGGYPIDIYSSLVRNLVRIVDLFPPPYGIGLASVFISSDYKRLGDYAAGTIVIKERQAAHQDEPIRRPASPSVSYYMPLIRNIDVLTAADYQILHRFVQRRYQFEIPVQAYLGMRLALPLIDRMQLDLPIHAQLHYADIVEAIERRFIEDKGIITSAVATVDL